MENLEFAQFNVTCHTSNCENVDIVINVTALAESPNIICGPCGQQIADITPTLGASE